MQATATVWQATVRGIAPIPAAVFNPNNLTPMRGAPAPSPYDASAWNYITSPVTIDLDNRLAISSVADGNWPGAAFFVDSPGVVLRNFSSVIANETAIVAGSNGDGLVIENAVSKDVATFDLERFLHINNGADGLVLRNVQLASLWHAGITFTGSSTVNGLTLDRVLFDNVPDTPRDFYNGMVNEGAQMVLNNLRVTGSTFNAFRNSRTPFQLANIQLNNALFTGNLFQNGEHGLLDNNLAYIRSFMTGGTGNVISGNTFRMNTGMGYAIHVENVNLTNGGPGAFTIVDNVFTGQTGANLPVVELRNAGTTQVRRNLFIGSQSGDGNPSENDSAANAAFFNETRSNNQPTVAGGIFPWFPVGDPGPAPAYPYVAPAACTVDVKVRYPATTPAARRPALGNVQFDVYWMPASSVDADVYLGTYSATLSATGDYVIADIPFRLGAGKIRVQTIDGAGRNSQLSRSIPVTATDSCGPTVTVEQATSQADPTYVRDVYFDVVFDEPIADGSLTASDFTTSASTAPGVRVTRVIQSSPSRYAAVARADATGTIVLSLPAGAVTDVATNPSAASTSDDNVVTYTSPLSVQPAAVTVAEPAGTADFTIVRAGLAAGAPIVVSPTVADPIATVSPGSITMQTIATEETGTVRTIDNSVVDGSRESTVTFTVTSTDVNFDGLVIGPLGVTVTDDDTPDATQSTLAVSPDPESAPVYADDSSTYTATATVRNAAGAVVSGAEVSFWTPTGPDLSAAVCTTSAAGTCSITISSARPGTYALSATVGGSAVDGSPVDLVFLPLPGDADSSTLTVQTTGVKIANSGDPHVLVAEVHDVLGNPVVGQTVTFAGAGVDLPDPPTCVTGADGTCTIDVLGLSAGTFEVSGSIADGALVGSPVTVEFGVGPPNAAASQLTVSSGTRVADGVAQHVATVTVTDEFGNRVGGVAAQLAVTAPGADVGDVVETGTAGVYTAPITSLVAGIFAVSATLDGATVTGSPTGVQFVAGAPSADESQLTISAGPQSVGTGSYTVTAQIVDALGNPVQGVEVSFAVEPGSATLSAPSGTTNSAGLAAVTLTSETAGSFAVSATIAAPVGDVPVEIGGSPVTAVFDPGPPDPTNPGSVLALTGSPAVADGTTAITATATVVDGFGNPVPGVTVDFGAAAPAVVAPVAAVTDATGRATAAVTSAVAGTFDVTASVGGTAVTDSPQPATFVAGSVDADSSLFTVSSGTRVADGADTHTVTVTLLDSNGNPVPGGAGGLSVLAGAFTVSDFTESSTVPGQYTATITATVAGSKDISVRALGQPLTGDGQPTKQVAFVAGPISAGDSTLAVSSGIRVVGSQTHTATATIVDAQGNPVAGASVTFSVTGATADPVSVETGPDGEATTTISATVSGAKPVFATVDVGGTEQPVGGPGTVEQVVFGPAAPDAEASTLELTPSGPITVGETYQATVTVRDEFDNPVPNVSVNFGVPAPLTASATSGTSDADGQVVVTIGSEVAGTFAVSATIAAGAVGGSPVDAVWTAGAADPASSVLVVSSGTRIADGADEHTATVTARDAFDNPVAGTVVTFTLPTALNDGSGTVQCTTGPAGTCTVPLTATVAGTYEVAATIGGEPVPSTANTATFVAGPADADTSELVVTTGSRVANGIDFHTATVTVRDAAGNAAGAGVDVEIDAGDLTVSGPCITGSTGQCTVALRTSVAGSFDVAASIAGSEVGTGSPAVVTFVAGPPSAATSTITADPTSLLADGAATSTLTVSLYDAYDNKVTSDAGVVVLAIGSSTGASPGTLVGAAVYAGNGTYTQQLLAPTTPGTDTIGFTLDGATGGDTAAVTYTVGGPDPTRSGITVAPATLTVGGNDGVVRVVLRDAVGNQLPTGGADVEILAQTGLAVLDPDGVVDNGDGTYTLAFTSPDQVGTARFGFTVDGAAGAGTATVTFVAGPSSANDHSTIAAAPTTLEADGTSTSTITVTIYDAFGNVRDTGGDTVEVFLVSGGGTLDAGGVTDNGDGTYTITLTAPNTAGEAVLGFSVNGVEADPDVNDTATVDVTYTAGAADPTTSEIAADPTSIVADGEDTSTITVTLRDAEGNRLTTDTDDVVISLAGGTGTVGPTTAIGDGQYRATLTAPLVVGSGELGFTVNGATADATATVTYVAGPVDPNQSLIAADPVTTVADGAATSTITVTVRDANGNVVVDPDVDVEIVVQNPGATAGTVGGTTDNGDGTYTATLTAPTQTGGSIVGFSVEGDESDNTATVAHVPGAADPDRSTITADPESITANGSATSTVTVTLFDAQGNRVLNPPADLSVEIVRTSGSGSVGDTTDVGDGTYTAVVTAPSSPGSGTFGFTIEGETGQETATVEYTVGAPTPGTSTLTATPTVITADGTATSTLRLQLRDSSGSALGPGDFDYASLTVEIVSNAGTPAGTLGPVTNNDDGTFSAVLTSPTTVGSEEFGFSIDGTEGDDTETVQYVAGAPSLTESTISASPTSLTADGVSTTTLTVTVRDANGNRYDEETPAVVFDHVAGVSGSMGTPQWSGNGVWTVVVTAPTTVGSEEFGFSIGDVTADDTVTVQYTVGPPSAATSTIEAADTSIEVEETTTLTVTLLDASGNPVGASDAEVTIVLAAGTGSVGPVTDNDDGTYTATVTAPARVGSGTFRFTVDGVFGTQDVVITYTDTVDPEAPVITSPEDGSATSDTTPVIRGTGEPGATVVVRNGDGDEVCTVTVEPDGSWSCTPLSPLPEGETELTAIQTDPAGNTGPPSNSVTVTVDTEVPEAPPVDPTDGTEVSGSGAEPGNTITVTQDGETVCTATVRADGTWSCTPDDPLADGTQIDVTQTDPAGNTSPPTTVVVDAPPDRPVIASPADGATITDSTPEIRGTGQPGADLTVTDDDGNEVCTTTVLSDGSWSCTPATELPDGTITLRAVQTDTGGESSPSAPVTITIDTTPPPPPGVDPTDGTAISGTGIPGNTIRVTNPDGDIVCTATVASDGTWSCDLRPPEAPGTDLTVVQIDPAGRVSSPVVVTVTVVTELTVEVALDPIERRTVQTATGRGFLPGEQVTGTMLSDPIDLGTQTADAGGVVTFEWYVGDQVDLGEHTVELVGATSGTVSTVFTVIAADDPTPPDEPDGEEPDDLPSTGAPDVRAPLILGLLLLVGGAVLVWRRRVDW